MKRKFYSLRVFQERVVYFDIIGEKDTIYISEVDSTPNVVKRVPQGWIFREPYDDEGRDVFVPITAIDRILVAWYRIVEMFNPSNQDETKDTAKR
jgi:hypothetical protein